MSKSFCLAFSALLVLLSSLRQPSSADEPPKANKQRSHGATYYDKHLTAMREPLLSKLAEVDRTATVYRFVWLPSFHNPIAVRFVKSADGAVVHAVRLDSQGGYEPGNILRRKSAKLNPAHWQRIANALAKAKFWTLPTSQRPPFGRLTTDGDLLVVEGASEGKYHIVIRHSPPGGNFVDLCRAMLFMSGIDVRQLWFEYRD